MDVTLTDINPETLEAGYAVLTGGRNLDGHPIIYFPSDTLQELQQCATGDLLLLLQYYAKVASPKIAILMDMRTKWTESDIIKGITAFDELQNDRRGTITNAYIIKPEEKSKLRVLKRCLLRKSSNGRLLPFYKVNLLDSLDDIYNHIDRSQLTTDFGGTLEYNHLAWVDFQRSFSTTLTSANILRNKLMVVKKHTMKLRETGGNYGVSRDFINRRKEITAKYECILKKHNVRETIFKCEDALQRLDNPDKDPTLINVNRPLVIEMKNKFIDLFDYIIPEVEEMDRAMSIFEDEMNILTKLYECRRNTDEVKETISLLRLRIPEPAVVGKDITEATNFRAYFIATALEPSKDIVACATSILKNLDSGSKTTQRTYNMAFDIAKQLTQSIQPFTRLINTLNEDYTKIHVFHTVLEKMIYWKSKASLFIIRQLTSSFNDKVIHTSDENENTELKELDNEKEKDFSAVKTFGQALQEAVTSECKFDIASNSIRNEQITENKETSTNITDNSEQDNLKTPELNEVKENEQEPETTTITVGDEKDFRKNTENLTDNNVEYNTCNSILLNRPDDWSAQLKMFYRKHPPPKKKHMKLLTKYEPIKCHRKLKSKADTVAERTLFIISFLRKKIFKMEDIIRIQQWEMEDCVLSNTAKGALNSDSCILEVTLV